MFPLPQTPIEAPAEDGWVFPWDHPREPREGDNQALAINTEDGSTVVDVALALVWVTDGGPVDQWNDAWALASCTGCTTTAIAFQTLIVVGYAQIITPVNAAVAANYACEAKLMRSRFSWSPRWPPCRMRWRWPTSPRFGRSSKS